MARFDAEKEFYIGHLQSENDRLHAELAEANAARERAEAKLVEIRGHAAPIGHDNCTDCGRAMVWQRTGVDYPSSWMCPNCVLGRLARVEALIAKWKGEAEPIGNTALYRAACELEQALGGKTE